MSAPVQLAALLLALIVSAQAHVTVIVLGSPVAIPALWLVALAVVLALAVLVLWLLRSILRDGGLLLRPRTVET